MVCPGMDHRCGRRGRYAHQADGGGREQGKVERLSEISAKRERHDLADVDGTLNS